MALMKMRIGRIRELRKKIAYADGKRKEFLHYVEALKKQHQHGIISYSDFLGSFYKKHNGKNINEWIEHLEHYIMECKMEINREKIHMFLFWLV